MINKESTNYDKKQSQKSSAFETLDKIVSGKCRNERDEL